VAGRTAREAAEAYVESLQRAVSCVTLSVFMWRRDVPRTREPVDVVLGSGELLRLRGRDHLHLRVRLRIRVVRAEPPAGQWEARTAAYEYRLSDGDDREIVAYHWHPESVSHVQAPHLHLGPAAEVGRPALATAHLPTGWVGLGEVVRLAIDGLGTAPIRRDWDRVLDAARAAPAEA